MWIKYIFIFAITFEMLTHKTAESSIVSHKRSKRFADWETMINRTRSKLEDANSGMVMASINLLRKSAKIKFLILFKPFFYRRCRTHVQYSLPDCYTFFALFCNSPGVSTA